MSLVVRILHVAVCKQLALTCVLNFEDNHDEDNFEEAVIVPISSLITTIFFYTFQKNKGNYVMCFNLRIILYLCLLWGLLFFYEIENTSCNASYKVSQNAQKTVLWKVGAKSAESIHKCAFCEDNRCLKKIPLFSRKST